MESLFHTTGSPVWIWVNNEQGWVKGTVRSTESDGKLQVSLESGGTARYKPEDCPLRNVESRMGVEVGNCQIALSRCLPGQPSILHVSQTDECLSCHGQKARGHLLCRI